MIEEIKATVESPSLAVTKPLASADKQCAFIGHGRESLWLNVRRVLREEWGIEIPFVLNRSQGLVSRSSFRF